MMCNSSVHLNRLEDWLSMSNCKISTRKIFVKKGGEKKINKEIEEEEEKETFECVLENDCVFFFLVVPCWLLVGSMSLNLSKCVMHFIGTLNWLQ